MRFIRFVLGRRNQDSGLEEGLFRLAYELRDSSLVEPTDRESLAETLTWFDKNLEQPARFNRTQSKGFYRRNTRGIAWFKETASDHLARMHAQGNPREVRARRRDAVRFTSRICGLRGLLPDRGRAVLGHTHWLTSPPTDRGHDRNAGKKNLHGRADKPESGIGQR